MLLNFLIIVTLAMQNSIIKRLKILYNVDRSFY
jgi:hypothetical protein